MYCNLYNLCSPGVSNPTVDLKRPKNGFIRFAMKHRHDVAMQHPNLDNREISRILGVKWRKLTLDEKNVYE